MKNKNELEDEIVKVHRSIRALEFKITFRSTNVIIVPDEIREEFEQLYQKLQELNAEYAEIIKKEVQIDAENPEIRQQNIVELGLEQKDRLTESA